MLAPSSRVSVTRLGAALTLLAALGAPVAGAASFTTFESGQVRPLAMSPDGTKLFATNTPDNRLEIFTVSAGGLSHMASVPVGLEPVAVAARTNTEVWVVNHLSDSISIVDVGASPPRVVARCWWATSRATSCSRAPAARAPSSPTAHRGQNRPAARSASSPRPASDAPTSGCSTPPASARASGATRSPSCRSSATRRERWRSRREAPPSTQRCSTPATRPPPSTRARCATAVRTRPAPSAGFPCPAACRCRTPTSWATRSPRPASSSSSTAPTATGRIGSAGTGPTACASRSPTSTCSPSAPARGRRCRRRPPASPTSAPSSSTWR